MSTTIKVSYDDVEDKISYFEFIKKHFRNVNPEDLYKLLQAHNKKKNLFTNTSIPEFKLAQILQAPFIVPVVANLPKGISEEDLIITGAAEKNSYQVKLNFPKEVMFQGKTFIFAQNQTINCVALQFIHTFPVELYSESRKKSNNTGYSAALDRFYSGYKVNVDQIIKTLRVNNPQPLTRVDFLDELKDIVYSFYSGINSYHIQESGLSEGVVDVVEEQELPVIPSIYPTPAKNEDQLISYVEYDNIKFLLGFILTGISDEKLTRSIKIRENKQNDFFKSAEKYATEVKNNYLQTLYKHAFIKKYGKDAYQSLKIPQISSSSVLKHPVIPDIRKYVDAKTFSKLEIEVNNYLKKQKLISEEITDNRELINAVEAVKVSKFPDQRVKAFRKIQELLNFKTYKEWLKYEDVNLLCEHYQTLVEAEKKGATEKEIHQILSKYTSDEEADDSDYCKICGERLTYKEQYEGLINVPFDRLSIPQFDEIFIQIRKIVTIWIKGYMVSSGTTWPIEDIINKSTACLYPHLSTRYKAFSRQKNITEEMVNKRFSIYSNIFAAAFMTNLIVSNSKKLKLRNYDGNNVEEIFKKVSELLLKLLQNTLYQFPEYDDKKIIEAYHAAYAYIYKDLESIRISDKIDKTLVISAMKEMEVEIDKEKYQKILTDIDLDATVKNADQLKVIVHNLSKALIGYYVSTELYKLQVTVPSEDNISIKYTEPYSVYLNLAEPVNTFNTILRSVIDFNFGIISVKPPFYRTTRYFDHKPITDLNFIYGIEGVPENLKKLGLPYKGGHFHKHRWDINLYTDQNSRIVWKGRVNKETTTPSQISVLVDILCSVCGATTKFAEESELEEAADTEINITGFYRHYKYTCPETNSDHVMTKPSQNLPETCKNCGFKYEYVKNLDIKYFKKYSKKFAAIKTVKYGKILQESKEISLYAPEPPKEIKGIVEEFVHFLTEDNKQTKKLITQLTYLGATSGVEYARISTIPEEKLRSQERLYTLRSYTLYIVTTVERVRNASKLPDIGRELEKFNSKKIEKVNIEYKNCAFTMEQFYYVIQLLSVVAKADKSFAFHLIEAILKFDEYRSKPKENRLAEMQTSVVVNETDYNDYENTDVDVVDVNAVDPFSYENMDYDGSNEEGVT